MREFGLVTAPALNALSLLTANSGALQYQQADCTANFRNVFGELPRSQ